MNNTDDDKTLLTGISKGNEQSFGLFFERYRDRLFTFIFNITKSKEVSEEVVLDVFLKVWHARETAGEIKNAEAFMHCIARNKALDFLRTAKRNPSQQDIIWETMQETTAPDDKLIFNHTVSKINLAISQLPPQRQKVFDLHHNHDLNNEEIARKLSLSRNTVRNHLAASIQFIRHFLVDSDKFITLLIIINLLMN